jgi:hypothetical protein
LISPVEENSEEEIFTIDNSGEKSFIATESEVTSEEHYLTV